MRSLRRGLVLLVCSTQVGCYEWVAVPAKELPKLDARYEMEMTKAPPPRNAVLETSEGSVIEIGRNADARITTRGRTLEFTAPIVARVAGDDLWIQASNSPRIKFELSEVQAAEVAKFDGGTTAGAIVGGILGGTLVIVVLVLAVNHPSISE